MTSLFQQNWAGPQPVKDIKGPVWRNIVAVRRRHKTINGAQHFSGWIMQRVYREEIRPGMVAEGLLV